MVPDEAGKLIRVFIVGCPRSGTTLLQKLLSERYGFFTLPETHTFSRAVGGLERRAFGSMAAKAGSIRDITASVRIMLDISTPHPWKDLLPALESAGLSELGRGLPKGRMPMRRVAEIFKRTMDAAAASCNCIGWIEKTPDHVHYLDFVHRLLPEAWVVHVIRDGRDTVASIIDAAQRYRRPWAVIYPSVERAVARWNKSMIDSASNISRQNAIALSYETLIKDPVRVVETIGHRIGAGQYKNDKPVTHKSLALSREAWKENAISGGVQRPDDKWMGVLNEDQRALVGRTLIELPDTLRERLDEFTQLCTANPRRM